MAYENIVFRKRNLTMIDGYFYMMDEEQDALIVKTDDGTQAYSYPLDTTLTSDDTCSSLEYDGYNFWSLHKHPSADTVYIRRWYIENYVLKLAHTYEVAENGSDKFDSNAFTVEHYHVAFNSNEPAGGGNKEINVDTDGKFDVNDKLTNNMTVVLGPNANGETEIKTVAGVSATTITFSTDLNYSYNTGDPIKFYNKIWLFNNFNGLDDSTGAIYTIDPYSIVSVSYTKIDTGGAYKDVEACTFFDVSDYLDDMAPLGHSFVNGNALAYIKTTNLIFLNPDDLNDSFGSMVMDNIEDNQADVISIYDITMYEKNIYRLQTKATYYGTTTSFQPGGTYSYQLSTLEPFITSISMRSNRAILPANGTGANITAVVRNQYNRAIASRAVDFTHDGDGALTVTSTTTNGNGEAFTTYNPGPTAREVKVTATASQES